MPSSHFFLLFFPLYPTGFLITSFNDITILLTRIISGKGNSHAKSKLLITLLEPTIEWIMKCIFKDASKVSNGVVPIKNYEMHFLG